MQGISTSSLAHCVSTDNTQSLHRGSTNASRNWICTSSQKTILQNVTNSKIMVNTSQEQLRYSARENILLGWPERGFYSVVKIYLIQIGQAHPVTQHIKLSRYQATGLRVSNQGTLLNLLYLRKNLSLLSTTTQSRFLRLEGPSQAPSHSPAKPKPSLMPYSYCDFFPVFLLCLWILWSSR